nr:efflux RND transporter periplasmic adaptor subunit [uncultured Gellertiella sp.]
MNTHTEHDRQLAEKLKSLSLQSVAIEPEPQRRGKARLLAGVGLLAICAAGAVMLFAPDALQTVRSSIAHVFASYSAAPAHVSAEKKVDDKSAVGASQQPASLAVSAPAARSVSGSGHVAAPVFAAVYPKQTARIASVAVEVGDHVVAGQVIVRLDDSEAVFKLKDADIAVSSAQLALQASEMELADAKAAVERTKGLVSIGAVTKVDGDKAVLALDHAQNNVALARQVLAKSVIDQDRAASVLRDLEITAPISGTVTARRAQVGEMVQSLGDGGKESGGLMTITDTASLVIDVDIAESSLALVRPGLTGQAILDGYPDQPFAVTVSRISPVASAERGTVGLRLALSSPPEGIRPNMAARVTIAGKNQPAIADQNKGTRP